MSRTLFWYIFKDLIRIFLLTSGALAGIMSFGGLLRPLTEQGLNVSQVSKILTYFMPAMTTYSLPIAALFATTMVYGRLSADNEIVGCRAAGISHLAMAFPAFVFGVIIAGLSMLFLCFIVPAFMLKAEKVIFSNVAQIVANSIERSHQLKLLDSGREPVTVFAQGAQVLPHDPTRPSEQAVALIAPTIMTFEPLTRGQRSDEAARIPKDFYTARQATAYISQDDQLDELSVTTELLDGMKFPRKFEGAMQGGIDSTQFTGKFPSQIRENTKFMNVIALQDLLKEPSKSKRVRTTLAEFVEAEQTDSFLRDIVKQLNEPQSECWIAASDREQYVITRGSAVMEIKGRALIIGTDRAGTGQRPVVVRHRHEGNLLRTIESAQLRISTTPDAPKKLFNVTLEFFDAITHEAERDNPRERYYRQFTVPMSPEVASIGSHRTADDYLASAHSVLPDQQRRLARDQIVVLNSVISELHSRVSFAISCLILVMIGCALGMMFRSGNFLSAFAASVVPALVCISLIITGQHTCENVPWDISHYSSTVTLGIGLIWSGNAAVFLIATLLLGRLQRQ